MWILLNSGSAEKKFKMPQVEVNSHIFLRLFATFCDFLRHFATFCDILRHFEAFWGIRYAFLIDFLQILGSYFDTFILLYTQLTRSMMLFRWVKLLYLLGCCFNELLSSLSGEVWGLIIDFISINILTNLSKCYQYAMVNITFIIHFLN